ncbi:Carboxymuconolactone decarboxylase family protein [Enhygromyxa salina]|uniref:Carboxymuconolactone decarboxylase family protein n=1 Tax=Enhygromyxa salina TaxID=215803 RepID=A0A2S9YJM3_9BACT|nr:carboxymuconolactone decarboxylase family protein [Enhygromyxa salina]PRQ05308.1 Carboxymuconolactone decarboxylase family protein [Enhygromyxa salina]
MTTIAVRPRQGAGLLVRFFYWVCKRRLGRVPGPVGVKAHQRSVLMAYGLFELALERRSLLSPRIKALANLKTAMEVGCRFCVDIGSSMAMEAGLSRKELEGLVSPSSANFSPLELDVLDYCVAMSATPPPPCDEQVKRLEAELGTSALVELTSVIAWENYRARFNHAVGAVEEGFTEQLCLLPGAEFVRESA